MERVAIRLMNELCRERPVRLTTFRGTRPLELDPRVEFEVCSARGWKSWYRGICAFRRMRRSDIAILVGVWVAVPCLLARPFSSRSSVLVWEHSLIREKVATAPKLRLLSYFARFLYPLAREVVAVSGVTQSDVLRLSPKSRVTSIPNLIKFDPELVATECRQSAAWRNLVVVSALTRTKGVVDVLSALTLLGDKYRLTIVGDGPERQELEKFAESQGISALVRFAGRVDGPAVVSELSASDLLVHPSAGETFGMVYFEAAEANVPVLSRRSRVAEEFIPSLVPGETYDGDASDLARAIQAFDFARAVDMSTESRRQRRSVLSEIGILEKWNALFEDLVGSSGGRSCL
ncbi:glycosyltransferase [Nocardioides sp. CCNWLW216]